MELKKSVSPEIIEDFQIRVKWFAEGQGSVEAELQLDPSQPGVQAGGNRATEAEGSL